MRLSGVAPALGPIKMTKNEDCCGTSFPNLLYEVGNDSALRSAEVFLKGIDKGKPNPKGTITLENVRCASERRVQGVSVGQRIRASDLILHDTSAGRRDEPDPL